MKKLWSNNLRGLRHKKPKCIWLIKYIHTYTSLSLPQLHYTPHSLKEYIYIYMHNILTIAQLAANEQLLKEHSTYSTINSYLLQMGSVSHIIVPSMIDNFVRVMLSVTNTLHCFLFFFDQCWFHVKFLVLPINTGFLSR